MQTKKVGKYELAYVDEGKGFPLLLIHGLAGDHQAWTPQIEAWRSTYRVIAVDTRGAGESTQIDEPVTIEDLANDYVQLIDALELPEVHVIGRSMGGCVGQWIALKRPERVKSLTMLASCGRFDPLALRCLDNMREVLEITGSWAAHARHSVRNFVAPTFFNTQPEKVQAIEDLIGSSTRLQACYVQQNRAVSKHDLLNRLNEISCPVLVMSGGLDPLGGPMLTQWMLERLRDATHIAFPESSHFFLMEESDKFMAAMNAWLAHHTDLSGEQLKP